MSATSYTTYGACRMPAMKIGRMVQSPTTVGQTVDISFFYFVYAVLKMYEPRSEQVEKMAIATKPELRINS